MIEMRYLEIYLILGMLMIKGECYSTALIEQRFAIEPQDQTAIVGSRVTLPCRVINMCGALQWTKDDFALGTHRALNEFLRYSMIGADEEGDFSLAIDPVTLDDDARYQCQVSSGPNGELGIRSRFAKLTVLVAPRPPIIVQGTNLETTEDSEVQIECISQGGKPPSEITWIDGLGNVVTSGISYSYDRMPDDQRVYISKSILRFAPKKEHDNTTFVCQAQNTADRTYRSAKILIRVKYAPKVTVKIVGGNENQYLMEGSDVKLVCKAEANPSEVTYRWYINQQLIPEATTQLIIKNINRTKHDSIVKCEARNLVGKSEDSQTLDVAYGPKFKQKPRSLQADSGTIINLVCDVEGNPPPDVTWIYGNDKIIGRSSNLTITVSYETIGRYYCRAHVPGFPDIGAEAVIRMKGPPTIVREKMQFGLPGDNIRLECAAYSVPLPEKISWSFNGVEITGNNHQEYAILEDPLPEGIKSTLIIRESRPELYGTYNCSSRNQYGTEVAQILLKLQRSFPVTVVLTAVGAGLVLVVTLIMVIILCQRKTKKPSLPDISKNIDKHCRDSDKSSNISEIKLETGTGSTASNMNYCGSDYGGGHDTDSIITRVAVPLAGPVPIDHRYSDNRYSAGEYGESIISSKDTLNSNGYLPFMGYSKDVGLPTSAVSSSTSLSLSSTSGISSTGAGLDPRYSATYGNPFLRNNHSPSLSVPNRTVQPPPPPYSTLRNGLVPQLSKLPTLSTSHYIVGSSSQPSITKKAATQATHV